MKFFILVLLLVFTVNLFAQERLNNDSSAVAVRAIDNNALSKYKQDKAFRYERSIEPSKSVWERFWDWVWYWIDVILSKKSGRITIWSLLIIVAMAAIAYFALVVIGMDKQGLFGRRSKEGLEFDSGTDDIHNISFNEAISQAVSNKNFRLAVRLLYLQSLKKLSDKGYIFWEINKTNTEYVKEVSSKPWRELFEKLTNNFEYTWYGEVNIRKEDFEDLQLQFQQFNNTL